MLVSGDARGRWSARRKVAVLLAGLAVLAAVNMATRDSRTAPPPQHQPVVSFESSDPVLLRVAQVNRLRSSVDFELSLHNTIDRTLGIDRIVSPGLVVTVVEPTPIRVQANSGQTLHVVATLPDCDGLSPEAEPGVPPFGQLAVVFEQVAGHAQRAQAFPPPETARIYPALVSLRLRTCPPGSYRRHPPG